MGQLAQSLRENLPKSFPSDTEKNLKQCMVVTLRSGKELEEPKKNLNEEEQPEKQKVEAKKEKEEVEIEEKIEAEKNKVGVELKTKEMSKNMMKLSREE